MPTTTNGLDDPEAPATRRAAGRQTADEPASDQAPPRKRLPAGNPATQNRQAEDAAEAAVSLEVRRLMAQSERRHDLETRLAMMAIEYDRALSGLQAIVRRYDELQAECEAARPPIHIQSLVPTILRTALKLARHEVYAQYPELRSTSGRP